MNEATDEAILKWAWRHCTLEVEEFDTVESGLIAAYDASEGGSEWMECIEHIVNGAVVRTYTLDDAEAYWSAREARRPPTPPTPPVYAFIELRHDDDWAIIATAADEAEMVAMVNGWSACLGADRVRSRLNPLHK